MSRRLCVLMIMRMLPGYRVRARNTAADSENRIHDDSVAANYGFRGGLVPGITVYAYMTVPLVERFGMDWLERGSMQVKFHQPFYDGEELIVRCELDQDSDPMRVAVRAERNDGTTRATALATVNDPSNWLGEASVAEYPEAPLPPVESRPLASREYLIPGSLLGTLKQKFSLPDEALLESLDEQLPIYYGSNGVAHPFALLRLSNEILMSNFKLGPWIHASSDVINRSAVRNGDVIWVRGRVRECFEKKGHEFVVLDLLLVGSENQIVQQVRHTAIYRPRRTLD